MSPPKRGGGQNFFILTVKISESIENKTEKTVNSKNKSCIFLTDLPIPRPLRLIFFIDLLSVLMDVGFK